MSWFTPSRRRRIYDVGTGLAILLASYGVINGDVAHAFDVLLAAAFNIARRNVNDDEPDDE